MQSLYASKNNLEDASGKTTYRLVDFGSKNNEYKVSSIPDNETSSWDLDVFFNNKKNINTAVYIHIPVTHLKSDDHDELSILADENFDIFKGLNIGMTLRGVDHDSVLNKDDSIIKPIFHSVKRSLYEHYKNSHDVKAEYIEIVVFPGQQIAFLSDNGKAFPEKLNNRQVDFTKVNPFVTLLNENKKFISDKNSDKQENTATKVLGGNGRGLAQTDELLKHCYQESNVKIENQVQTLSTNSPVLEPGVYLAQVKFKPNESNQFDLGNGLFNKVMHFLFARAQVETLKNENPEPLNKEINIKTIALVGRVGTTMEAVLTSEHSIENLKEKPENSEQPAVKKTVLLNSVPLRKFGRKDSEDASKKPEFVPISKFGLFSKPLDNQTSPRDKKDNTDQIKQKNG